MIVDVKYLYRAEVLRHRKRNSERLLYEETLPLELREVSVVDAPVAIRYETDGVEDGKPPVYEELRWFDDSFWEAMRVSVSSGEPEVHRDADWYVAQSGDPRAFFGAVRGQETWRDAPRGSIEADKEVRQVVKDEERPAKRAEARASLRDTVVLEGLLWRRVAEPRLVLRSTRIAGALEYDALVDRESRGEQTVNVFRLDHGHRIAQAKCLRPGVRLTLPDVQVLIPGLLGYRADERHLLTVGAGLLDAMKGKVADASREYFGYYADLREAHRSYAPSVDDATCDFGPYAKAVSASALVHVAAFRGDADKDAERAIARWEGVDDALEAQSLLGI